MTPQPPKPPTIEEATIDQLKAQLAAAQSQVAHLQDALECIERAVGFVPKDEPLAEWVKRVVEERDAAHKACAEMRMAARMAADWFETGPADFQKAADEIVPALEHALSTDCGKDYISKEQVKPLAEAAKLFLDWWYSLDKIVPPELIEAQHKAFAHAKELI